MSSLHNGAERVGVVCIRPSLADPAAMSFEHLYGAIGKNTGNYMFTQAMFRQIDGDVRQIGFDFDPDKVNASFDKVVIPAANWLNAGANWDWLTALIERLEIPVITIGIGLQAETRDLARVRVSDSALAFARVLARKAAHVSTRGDFTRDWLHSVGLRNVVTTGCPSLYMRIDPAPDHAAAPGRVILQATRYGLTQAFAQAPGVNQTLFRLAGSLGLDMIYQSEPEEIDALLHGAAATEMARPGAAYLPGLYGLPDMGAFQAWLGRHGKVYFDLDRWAGFLQSGAGVIGTRLHGAILALNSGRPGILITHDSRTAELAEFAAIPAMAPGTDLDRADMAGLHAILGRADVATYLDRRRSNAAIYREFLTGNGIAVRDAGMLE